MKTRLVFFTLACAGSMWAASSRHDVAQRIQQAARVFDQFNANAGKGIPRQLLAQAECIGIVPGVNGASIAAGASYTKGVVVCRSVNNTGWTAPSTVRVEAGTSWPSAPSAPSAVTDVVFVVLNKAATSGLMQEHFIIPATTLNGGGTRAHAMAGDNSRPLILSYARTRGDLGNAPVTALTLRPDNDDNHAMYGGRAGPKEILAGKVRPPASARELYVALNNHVPPHKSLDR